MERATSTATFVSIIAHGSMLFSLLMNRVDYVLASLPAVQVDPDMYTDIDVSLVVAISVDLFSLTLEIIFLFCQPMTNLAATISLLCHTIACTSILKFIIDFHTVGHFWIISIFFNFSPTIYQVYVFLLELNKQKFC